MLTGEGKACHLCYQWNLFHPAHDWNQSADQTFTSLLLIIFPSRGSDHIRQRNRFVHRSTFFLSCILLWRIKGISVKCRLCIVSVDTRGPVAPVPWKCWGVLMRGILLEADSGLVHFPRTCLIASELVVYGDLELSVWQQHHYSQR